MVLVLVQETHSRNVRSSKHGQNNAVDLAHDACDGSGRAMSTRRSETVESEGRKTRKLQVKRRRQRK